MARVLAEAKPPPSPSRAYIYWCLPVVLSSNSTTRQHQMALLEIVSLDAFKLGATVSVIRGPPPLIDAYDLAEVITQKNRNHAGDTVREAIKRGAFAAGALVTRSVLRANGREYKTKFVAYEDALEMIFAIGGADAARYKAQFAKLLTRVFAGDATLAPVLAANAASNAPIHALARESETMGGGHALNDGDMGIEDAGTGSELDDEEDVEGETLKVTKTVWDNVSRQKTEMKEMKTLAEYISDKQKEGAAAQIKAEEAKQTTFTVENTTLQAKFTLELGQMDEKKKRVAEDRDEELAFIKKRRLALEGPLVVDTPPVAAVPAPDPRSVMEIVEEEDYWKDLTRPQRKELVCTVGGRLPKVGVYAAPGKVSKVDPYGKEWDTNVYDRQDHSAIRGISHIVLKEMAKKLPKGRVTRPRDSDSRQRGLDEFTGFNIQVTRI